MNLSLSQRTCADQVSESLQLEPSSRHIQIVIYHRKLKRRLNFVGALLENCSWKNATRKNLLAFVPIIQSVYW